MKCVMCSLCRSFSSFGGLTTHGYECEVVRETLFQMTDEDAEQYFLDGDEIGYYRSGDISLKRLLPSGFDFYDTHDWERYKGYVKALLLGDHPCILGSDSRWIPSAEALLEEYVGYVADQRRKMERENEELARLLRTIDKLEVVKEATRKVAHGIQGVLS